MNSPLRRFASAIVVVAVVGLAAPAWPAATINIINADFPGIGFNDPTPAAPVGGNPGTTLGAQRMNVFLHVAQIWGGTLTSTTPIDVLAFFDALACNANSAVLAGAASWDFYVDASGTILPPANTWYPAALTEKLAGADLSAAGDPDLFTIVNLNLGNPGCLTGIGFYLGLDGNHGTKVDLVAVLLHELGHGLGFSVQPTTASTGARFLGFPSRWEGFLFDNTAASTWLGLSQAQRAASAINPRQVAWNGANVTANAPQVLGGTPQLVVGGPFASANGVYTVGTADFGQQLNNAGVTGDIMPVVDQPNGTGLACDPLSPLNALAVNGNIALVDRGTCGFIVKVKNAQNAGARAVIVVDNVVDIPPPGLGGNDPTITIPAVRISLPDGNKLKAALAFRSRTRSGVVGTLGLDPARLAGADAFGRVLLFTPNPFQQGSSVSHYDTSAFPNLLMEPANTPNQPHAVKAPQDLTFELLKDMGW